MKILNSKIFTIFLAGLFVWMLFLVFFTEVEKKEIKKEESVIQKKIDKIILENQKLERFINSFNNRDFLDKQARLRLNYKIPGEEVVFVYQEDNSKKASSSLGERKEVLNNKWWQNLLKILKIKI
jgi:cell division protein FtsB